MATPPTDPAQVDPALVDPLFRELRQQHPEVDIVLLPQPAPVEADSVPALGHEQRGALAEALEMLIDDLVAVLAREASWTADQRAGRWRTDEGGLTWYESAVEVADLAEGANIALLRATGQVLSDLGWQAVPMPGDRPRIAARRASGESASATVRPETLVLTARTPLVRPSEGVAR